MIDRPKFKEIAYTKSKKKGIEIIIPEMKDKGRVEDVYDTVELKMDGIWGVFKCNLKGDWTISSRTGKIKKEGHTVREGCWGTTIIGEFMHGSHWAHQRGWDGRFYAYDMLYHQEFGDMKDWHFIDRRVTLGLLFEDDNTPTFMHLNHSNPAGDWSAIWNGYVEGEDYEGLVFKKDKETFKDATWARMKAKAEIDYICMGFQMGGADTKYKDTVGSIMGGLRNADGDLQAVCKVGGLTEIQRDFFRDNVEYFIGKVFTAHGYCFYPSGAIRHAKFKVFRKDKDSDECTFEQIPESYSMSAEPSGKATEKFERDHRLAKGRMDDIDLREGPLHTGSHHSGGYIAHEEGPDMKWLKEYDRETYMKIAAVMKWRK